MSFVAVALFLTMTPDRVETAKANRQTELIKLCGSLGFSDLPKTIFIRVFKQEALLEVWGLHPKSKRYVLVRNYPIAKMSGTVGPKRKEGDLQVPEGLYKIDAFNPESRFHLSLRVNYPNASDRILSDRSKPGGDIYIHGSNVSIGCMAMTNPKIEEIYLLALAAKRSDIPVHIFPARLSRTTLAELMRANPEHRAFWSSLQPIYDAFEKTRLVPKVMVGTVGRYQLR